MFIRSSIRRNKRGFTLLEAVIAMGISGLILAVIAAFSLFTGRSLATMTNYVELNQKSVHALDIMTREIRQSRRVTYISSDRISLKDVNNNDLTFQYYGPDDAYYPGQVLMKGASGIKVLLEDCDSFVAEGYRRTPDANYDFFIVEADDASLVKMIQIKWECYRDVFVGDKRTTESVQTAKVVLRYNPLKSL